MNIPTDHSYDIIIAGGGAAGLSLAYRLSQSTLAGKRTLIIEKEDKKINDRTWCFWDSGDNHFEEVVSKSWSKIVVRKQGSEQVLDISPYRYQMIRGIDFYRYTHRIIRKNRHFHFIKAEITSITNQDEKALIHTPNGVYTGELVFNSLPAQAPDTIDRKNNYLLQHFKGFVIKTKSPAFKADRVHFMDFSVPQQGQTRFGYVLPFNEKMALVEFTLFSEELLPETEYDILLTDYTENNLGIKDYEIVEREFGVIPMTDIPFASAENDQVVNIGVRGGLTKGSTGYTFRRIQDDCHRLVQELEANYPKVHSFGNRHNGRFRFYDSVLLHVLAGNLYPADDVFFTLFKKNPPQKVLKFLEEKTAVSEDIPILASMPVIPFLKGAIKAVFNKGTKKNLAKKSMEEFLKK